MNYVIFDGVSIMYIQVSFVGGVPSSSVSIATDYGLDGQGSNLVGDDISLTMA